LRETEEQGAVNAGASRESTELSHLLHGKPGSPDRLSVREQRLANHQF